MNPFDILTVVAAALAVQAILFLIFDRLTEVRRALGFYYIEVCDVSAGCFRYWKWFYFHLFRMRLTHKHNIIPFKS